jgi:hypothetical protein
MAIDLSKVKSRLEALKNQGTKSTYLWKPSPGKQVVRIVPYAHNPENPFIELHFHYNMNGKTYLSPSSFGRPDPIVEFANKLKKSQDKEEWKRGRALEPKMRTYVPILVRGLEHEGVKFWGMGKSVYQELLAIIADPDYGDITDPKNGRDIVVEFKTAEETGKSFPETSIRVKPNTSTAFDPSDKNVLEKVKNQKNVTELFPELTYDELATAMDAWLNSADPDGDAPAPAGGDEPAAATEEEVEEKATAAAVKASTTAKTAVKAPSTKDIADEFKDLFS